VLIDLPEGTSRHRPYVKYTSNGRDRVHIAFTEGHPRDFNNGIYHALLRKGVMQRINGGEIRALSEGPITPDEAVQVFVGGPDQVAWIQDVTADRGGRRVRMAFSVQRDSAGLPPGRGGMDHRYHWARWDGRAWWSHEIAYAGSRLYPGEDDYVGGICLHPDDPDVVFISTNVDPQFGTPLASGHYELFRGRRTPRAGWAWTSLTPGATQDHLRPVVPSWRDGRTVLLWLRGTYRAYTDYDLEVMVRVD
jgi:hypothetical protein